MVKMYGLIACALAACSSTPTSVDAPGAAHDAPATHDGGNPDAPAAACTGALYDPCTTSPGCMSNLCKPFGSAGFSVCTQTCSTANPCPAQNGTPIACNGMGFCRPTAPNACTP